MIYSKLKFKLSKEVIYKNLLRTLKPGQKIIVFILFKGVNKKLRVVSYTGTVSWFSKNSLKSILVLQQSMFKYQYTFQLNINCLNLFNFKLLDA
jgi:hypothetical protein